MDERPRLCELNVQLVKNLNFSTKQTSNQLEQCVVHQHFVSLRNVPQQDLIVWKARLVHLEDIRPSIVALLSLKRQDVLN